MSKLNIAVEIPDISKMIEGSLSEALSPTKIQGVIDKCCIDVVQSAIREQFQYGGNVKNKLEEHIKNTFGVDPSKLPVPEYTHLIAKGFKQALDGMKDEKIRKEAKDLMESLLRTAPKEIRLSELIELYIEGIKDDFDFKLEENNSLETEYDDDGRMLKTYDLCFEDEQKYPDSSSLANYRLLTVWCRELADDSHKLFLDVRYEDKEGKTAIFKDACYARQYNEPVGKMDLKNWTTVSSLSKLLYKMTTANTKIIMDVNNIPEDFEVTIECTCG